MIDLTTVNVLVFLIIIFMIVSVYRFFNMVGNQAKIENKEEISNKKYTLLKEWLIEYKELEPYISQGIENNTISNSFFEKIEIKKEDLDKNFVLKNRAIDSDK